MIMEKAEQLAQEWYLQNFIFFREINYQFSWKDMGELSQEYWIQQVNKLTNN